MRLCGGVPGPSWRCGGRGRWAVPRDRTAAGRRWAPSGRGCGRTGAASRRRTGRRTRRGRRTGLQREPTNRILGHGGDSTLSLVLIGVARSADVHVPGHASGSLRDFRFQFRVLSLSLYFSLTLSPC